MYVRYMFLVCSDAAVDGAKCHEVFGDGCENAT